MLAVIQIIGQLGWSHGGCTNFCNHNAGGSVREMGSGFEGSTGRQRKYETGESGVAGAGNIVDLAGGGWDGGVNFPTGT